MGTILEFRQPETSRPSADNSPAGLKIGENNSAEIIIFPGVRIDRNDGTDPSDTDAKPNKRAKRTARQKV